MNNPDVTKQPSPPATSAPASGSAAIVADLNSTWGYIANALTGLSHRGETDSPLVRDLIAAQEKIESIKKQMPLNDPSSQRWSGKERWETPKRLIGKAGRQFWCSALLGFCGLTLHQSELLTEYGVV